MSPQLSALWRVAALGSERDSIYVEFYYRTYCPKLGIRSSLWGAAGVPGRDGPSCMRCILRP